MKLVTFYNLSQEQAGALIDDEVLDLAAAETLGVGNCQFKSVAEILEGGEKAMNTVRELVKAASGAKDILRDKGFLRRRDQTKLLAPLPHPTLLFCAGGNYAKHTQEMGTAPPTEPTGFIKAAGCVTGPECPIVLPPAAPDFVDYEGELMFVFGKTAYNVPESEAMDYVAGYMCCNDVSARDWIPKFNAWMADPAAIRYEAFSDPGARNLRYKSFPTFMPCGPALVTADEIDNPHELRLRTTVNGELRQDTLADLTFKIPKLIAYFSRIFEFKPGDIMATGSPSGVGAALNPPVYLKAGDVVTVEIEKLGCITNKVVDFCTG